MTLSTNKSDPYQARLAAAVDCLAKQQFAPAQLLLQDVWLSNAAAITHRLSAAQNLIALFVGNGHIDIARKTTFEAQRMIEIGGDSAASFTPYFSFQAWRLAPFWWEPINGKNVRLRRASGKDAAWIKSAFSEPSFTQSVNKAYARKIKSLQVDQFANLLDKELIRPPVDHGSHMLLIEKSNGELIGLACLVAMDGESKRAEFIIGFTDSETPATLITESFTLFVCMAFQKAGLHKLTALIYEDNPRYKKLISEMHNLGFQTEGVHVEHFRLPEGKYIDMQCLALLDRQFFATPSVQRLIRRHSASNK